jgi:GMP synthase (glutamine-hydrolysing)
MLFAREYENVQEFISRQSGIIRERLEGKQALCAISGGVDSMVAALLVHRAVPGSLTCVFVDGLMRLNEREEVAQIFKEAFDIPLIIVDAQGYFLERLKGVTDPEQKRKIIGEGYIRLFEEEAKKHGKFDYLVQGTVYTDVLESGSPGSELVKSHHNVAGLPEQISFSGLLEPIRELFKEEVRQTGLALGLPENCVYRQTFPGPGLAVRIIGEVTAEKLDVLRKADKIVREEITGAGLDRSMFMYFAILAGVRSTGVKAGARSYGHVIAIRAVESKDVITAGWARLPYAVLEQISDRIVEEIPEVNRVVYDVTRKPPGTIEWE